MYWGAGSAIVSTTLGSCSPVVLASNQDFGWTGLIAVDGANIYWTNLNGIMTVPLSGGRPTMLAFYEDAPTAIALDTKYVYWISAGEIHRIAK